ncbi:DUF7210 family protein [Clostridium tyrobutyricum]|uniref:DUF7210 family protein n=1 Tax=Clostridium tyrobutyricum TaxID=1519 RepID=UPI001C3C7AB4|nr:hypothetical protein [Clostridium tyrobutyricum]MBV4438592.1 hypothetical protein [Clostridium tyrobutyricum]
MAAANTDNKQDETKTPETTDVKLIKNIKYGNKAYKIGDKITVKTEDIEEFKKAGVIKVGD